jgi:hypothetical protein
MARDINPPADDRPALKPSVRGDGPAAEDRRETPRFTVDRMVDDYLALYHRLVRR